MFNYATIRVCDNSVFDIIIHDEIDKLINILHCFNILKFTHFCNFFLSQFFVIKKVVIFTLLHNPFNKLRCFVKNVSPCSMMKMIAI